MESSARPRDIHILRQIAYGRTLSIAIVVAFRGGVRQVVPSEVLSVAGVRIQQT